MGTSRGGGQSLIGSTFSACSASRLCTVAMRSVPTTIWQGRHAGRGHLDLAIDTEAVEKPAIECRALLARGVVRDDVSAFEVVIEREFLSDAAVVRPGHAQVLFLEQRCARMVHGRELLRNDQQIGVPLLELLGRLVIERAQLQTDSTCLLVERLKQGEE